MDSPYGDQHRHQAESITPTQDPFWSFLQFALHSVVPLHVPFSTLAQTPCTTFNLLVLSGAIYVVLAGGALTCYHASNVLSGTTPIAQV